MVFKYDTHVHTSEVSPCGKVDARRLVKLYKAAGYRGMVVTDHFKREIFDENRSDKENVEHFLSGYRAALQAAEGEDFDVILGAELKLDDGTINEYLIVGLTEEFLYIHPRLYELTLDDLSRTVREAGLLLFQAHPMRKHLFRSPHKKIHRLTCRWIFHTIQS